MRKLRKGDRAQYIGDNPLMIGHTFTVIKREYNEVLIYAPIKYLDGSIHYSRQFIAVSDFILQEEQA